MKKISIWLTLLCMLFTLKVSTQISIPKQLSGSDNDAKNPKFSEIYENYINLKSTSDSLFMSDKKIADRWMYNEKSRLNIKNDSSYNDTDYSKAFKLFVENGPFCTDEDISDWDNIGPRYVGHYNGWVSAVHYNPDPTNEFYLLGGRKTGIFRSTNGGDNWTCVTDDLPYPIIGVRQIEANPVDPNYLVAITGEKSGVEAVQNGILTSFDGGLTWSIGTNEYIKPDGTIHELEQVREISFHESNSNLVIGITSKEIILSKDGGITWRQIDYPLDYIQSNTYFESIIISGNKAHLTMKQTGGLNTWYWSGDFFYNSSLNLWNVDWSLNRSDELHTTPLPLVSNTNPYSLDTPMSLNNLGQSDPNWYHHHLATNHGCNPGSFNPLVTQNVGGWEFIHTPGWASTDIGGIDKLTCISTAANPTYNNREITTEKYKIPIWLWNQPAFTGEFEVNCTIPEGARLKIYVSSIQFNISATSGSPWTICSYENYDPVIFENEIYDSGFATGGQLQVDHIGPFDPLQYNLRAPGIIEQGNASPQHVLIYYELEFDDQVYNEEQFTLNKFDIRLADLISPSSVVFSSTEDDRFFVASIGTQYKNVYRTLDNGENYLKLENAAIPAGFNINKHMFLASPNEEYTYYIGGTSSSPRRCDGNLAGTQTVPIPTISGSSGINSHDDFRSGKIYDINGEDYIVTGNDGGISEIVSADVSPQMNSINGDIILNMIYNLDVHQKDKLILVGLQDNGTRYFFDGDNNFGNAHGGDGSIAMVRRELDPTNTTYGFVVGDPQYTTSSALKDATGVGSGIIPGIVDDNITVDAYIGMRLEEYKLDPTRFITGLGVGATGNASVIVNRAANVTDPVEIDGSWRIESIAICQNNPETAYVAEGIPRGLGDSKLYKTTDDGFVWTPLNAVLNIPGHPIGSLNLTTELEGKYINALGADHDDPNLVYIGMSGIGEINNVVTNEYFRVLKSNDGGNTFDDWSQGLPALPVNYLLPIESANHIIFCATDAGVYYRMDGMQQWECFSNHLAKTRITDLSYNYCSKELYASTYGRGVWKTPVGLETESLYSEDITGNVIWNTDRDARSNIRVTSGSTLTIHSTIHIDADKKFIVEPGAKLIIDGGTLTNACQQYWTGIEVWGDGSLNQSPLNQGHVITRNMAKIEYAKEAISTWKRGDWSTTGGIVTAQNTEFVNNRTSVFFYPYHSYNPSNQNEIINTGSISDCQFTWTDDYIDTRPEPAVIFYNVYGPRVSGCDFVDSRAVLAPGDRRPTGILSLDAGYKVIARATQLNQAQHDVFATTGGYDVNNFENLEFGIHAMNANTIYSVTMDHCKFLNVSQAAQLSAVDNAVITRNLVELTTNRPADITSSQGIGINESTGFHVEGNTFTSSDPSAFSAGILTWDTGDANNKIYRNYSTEAFLANYAYGTNSNTNFNTSQMPYFITGLQWECNEGTDNKYDEANFAITGIAGQGVKLYQGSYDKPAGNKFTDPSSTNIASQLFHSDSEWMTYFHNSGNPLEIPTITNGNINLIPTSHANECPSSFETVVQVNGGVYLSEASESQVSSSLYNIKKNILLKENELQTNLAEGDDPALHELVENLSGKNKLKVRSTLIEASPYLSKSLLEELGIKPTSIFKRSWYVELIHLNIEIAREADFISFLESLEEPIPADDLIEIKALAKESFTDRGILEMQIMQFIEEESKAYNLLIANELSHDEEISWKDFQTLLVDRGNTTYHSELADKYLGEKNIQFCLNVLDIIDSKISEYNSPYIQQEMADYSTFKRYILEITNNTGIVESLQEEEVQQLNYMAEEMTGKAATQARNILCFHKGLCAELPVIIPDDEPQVRLAPEIATRASKFAPQELKVIPNPTQGVFILEVPKKCNIETLQIVDIQGRTVKFESLAKSENRMEVRLDQVKSGVFILKADCIDGSTYSTKVLVNN